MPFALHRTIASAALAAGKLIASGSSRGSGLEPTLRRREDAREGGRERREDVAEGKAFARAATHNATLSTTSSAVAAPGSSAPATSHPNVSRIASLCFRLCLSERAVVRADFPTKSYRSTTNVLYTVQVFRGH